MASKPAKLRPISRTTMVELLAAVYERHGWRRVEGESRAQRVQALYEITADTGKNRYRATPRPET